MKKVKRIKGAFFQELPENWGSMVRGGGLGTVASVDDGGNTYGTKEAAYCGTPLALDEVGDSPDAAT